MRFVKDEIPLRIFKSNYFIWPVISISALLACVLVFYLGIEDENILPDRVNYRCDYYTDEANGGKSQVTNYIASDSIIKLEFNLIEGFLSPYVGISITPVQHRFIDLSRYNQIKLRIKSKGIDRIGVSIYTLPVAFAKNQQQDEALFHTYLNLSNDTETHHIPISELESPDWWKDLHGIPTDIKFEADLTKILHLNIGTAYTPNIANKMSFEIDALTLTRDNHQLFNILGFIEVGFIVVLFSVFYLVLLFKGKSEEITVVYKPLDIQETASQNESYIQFISNNFQNNELTLELVSKETAIPQRRIAKAIQTKFNCNYKTYINRIRVNESTRLLLQTNLNIGEIAFKVGFNNQSNFNRVFKSELQLSPTEYREKYK